MELLKPDAKIKVIWELGFWMQDGTYIDPREALFDICIDIDNKHNLKTDEMSDHNLYSVLTAHLKLPEIVVLHDLESGHPKISDCHYVYDHYLSKVSHGFAPKSYKEIF